MVRVLQAIVLLGAMFAIGCGEVRDTLPSAPTSVVTPPTVQRGSTIGILDGHKGG